jgi:hypothetical protein
MNCININFIEINLLIQIVNAFFKKSVVIENDSKALVDLDFLVPGYPFSRQVKFNISIFLWFYGPHFNIESFYFLNIEFCYSF